jgi:hypothetical protein
MCDWCLCLDDCVDASDWMRRDSQLRAHIIISLLKETHLYWLLPRRIQTRLAAVHLALLPLPLQSLLAIWLYGLNGEWEMRYDQKCGEKGRIGLLVFSLGLLQWQGPRNQL